MGYGNDGDDGMPREADLARSPQPTAQPVDLPSGVDGCRRLRAFADAALSLQLALTYRGALASTAGLPAAAREHELRAAAAELASVLRRSPHGMLGRMEQAHAIATRFPGTQRAWTQGRIDEAHARVIERHGSPIEDDARRREFEALLLEEAERLTPGQLERLARRLAMEARGQSAEDRHREAAQQRFVRVEHQDDGMSLLMALLPSWQAQAIHDRLTEHASALREAHVRAVADDPDVRADPRGVDALRADTLVDLALGADSQQIAEAFGDGAPRIQARVSLQVPVLAALGHSAEPAELLGVGPVPLDVARELALEQPAYERVLTDPVTQLPLAVETYRPSAALQRTLAARDQTCRFPGCRRTAMRCDLDHTVDWARGGATSLGNLAHLCRAHHVLKHQTRWSVRQLGGGVLEWTTPSGRTIIDRPPAMGPRFEPDPAPAPPRRPAPRPAWAQRPASAAPPG